MLNTVGALVLRVLLPALACFLLPQQVYDHQPGRASVASALS